MVDKFRRKKITRIQWILIGLFVLGIPLFLQYPWQSAWFSFKDTPARGSLVDRQDFKDALALQDAFIRNAKLIKPTVVSVNKLTEIVQKSKSRDFHSADPKPWYFLLKEWFVNTISEKQYRVENVGSGIIINSDGYILTNNHVVSGISSILIKLSNGKDYFAKRVGFDGMTDLAVLKISSLRSLPHPAFGKSETLKVGEWVMAIGNPYGLEGTVTVGVVSGKGRRNLGIATFENFIQTDASINPGNSGGPLINMGGEVIGINTAVAEIGSGVGFAIPIEMALHITNQLIDSGEVKRGWLGVGIQSLTPELADTFHLTRPTGGVLVNTVDNNAPAQNGGIQRGDIIIQFDGREVPGSKIFQEMVADTRIGKVVAIKVIRNGTIKILEVKIGKLAS